jgi:hypothetical protein
MDVLSFTFQGIKDGRTSHELYTTHHMMLRRCYNEKCSGYKNYGGKGITVCDSWIGPNGFWVFVEDMGSRPDGLTLDRIDPYGNYTKENCRWADKPTQANNTRQENSNNTTGVAGVHWCNRELIYLVQISLNGTRTCIGRFDEDKLAEAEQVYADAKSKKLSGYTDDEIYKEFVLDKRPAGSKGFLNRNKTSKYYGVSQVTKTGKWVAHTTKYLGIRRTEEDAYQLVLDWLKEQEGENFGSTFGPDGLGCGVE